MFQKSVGRPKLNIAGVFTLGTMRQKKTAGFNLQANALALATVAGFGESDD
jgi:hypothetical protein